MSTGKAQQVYIYAREATGPRCSLNQSINIHTAHKTMSSVVRRSSPVVVRPSRPVIKSDTIKLSAFDKVVGKIPVTVLLVFENPIHEPANTIMRVLSETLVHYYPFAGRIVAGIDDGGEEDHILCNGEGVAFISASCSNCALKEAIFLDHSPCERALLQELAIYYPAKGCGPADPLLLMQVTEFSCGGFVLGVTWNHVIADGSGMAQFLQAVGELARGLSSPSIIPVRLDDSLPRLPPSMDDALRQVMLTLVPSHLAYLDITVPSRSINLIRAEFGSRFDCQPCTMFEAVVAVLWQCRTRAIMSNSETPALLMFSANVRKHVGAKPGYYGNCTSCQFLMAPSGTVASADILDLVKMIKRAKEDIPHTSIVNQISNLTEANKGQMQQLFGPQLRYNELLVTSWRNLGLEDADFGSGKAARVTSYEAGNTPSSPACIVCLPCQGEGGANVCSAFVKEEHAQAFLQELAKLM